MEDDLDHLELSRLEQIKVISHFLTVELGARQGDEPTATPNTHEAAVLRAFGYLR